MKICVYGAGAIGGLFSARLAAKGNEVSVIEVGPTLAAIQKHGIRLQSGGQLITAKVHATSDPATLGPQDLVIIAVKGPVLSHIASKLAPLLGPDTAVLTAMNGVPWWLFQGFGGKYSGMQLESIDRTGIIAAAIPAHRIIGCVIILSCHSNEPGFVQLQSGNRLIIGEPDNSDSARVHALADLLAEAGFQVSVSASIQADIWSKLLSNMTQNPISALTGATCDRILNEPLLNELCLNVMREAVRVGEKIGCAIHGTLEERNETSRRLGAFKTSMLQDLEARKPVELDVIVGAVGEIARRVGEPTPFIDALFGLARLQAQELGLYPKDAAGLTV